MRRPGLYFLLGGLLLGLHVHALGLDFYIDDPALYALISRDMVQRGDWLQLQWQGVDWLDKPHWPFWVSACFFRVFGASPWSYKLPLFLALLGTSGYLFAFVKRQADTESAWLSVLVLLSAQHTVINSSEGRAENWVMLSLMGAAFHLAEVFRSNGARSLGHVAAMSAWAAMGMMSKGTFVPALMAAVVVFVTVSLRAWHKVPVLLMGLPVLALCVLPEVYALYVQFDSQPEKKVSGLRWFLWDSQFSRFINLGPITRKSGDVFFFVHTSLWAFLPWPFLLWPAWWASAKAWWKDARNRNPTYVSISFLLASIGFALFSLSKFQLPHYLSVVFPFFSVMVVRWLREAKMRSWQYRLQRGIQMLLGLGVLVLEGWVAPEGGRACLLLACVLLLLRLKDAHCSERERIVFVGVLSAVALNVWVQGAFWPMIAQLRGDVQAGKWLKANAHPGPVVVWGGLNSSRLDFFADRPVLRIEGEWSEENLPRHGWLATQSREKMEAIEKWGPWVQQRGTWKHHESERWKPLFLNERTRESTLTDFVVYEWNRPD